MSAFILALLLQSFPMLPRVMVENPAGALSVPKKLQKDYEKIWARFVKGTEDARLLKDSDKLLKKQPDFTHLMIVEAYIDLYNHRFADAERKLERVLGHQPKNRIALSYLAELAFARQDYPRASDLYANLLEVDPSRIDVEPKRQKALILATENLIQNALTAEQSNRINDAEVLYRQALRIAPREPSLHGRLGELYVKQKKWDQALDEFQKARDFGGSDDETDRHIAETLANLGRTEDAKEILDRLRRSGSRDAGLEAKVEELEDLGRWGRDIAIFREIQGTNVVSREQLAAMIFRYFPQVAEFRRTAQILTDIQDSWARPEIQTLVGVGALEAFPNHTFQPTIPVSRGELATVLARLTRLLSISLPNVPPVPTSDVGSSNALYQEIQMAVSHGLLPLDEAGSFNLDATVSGEIAVQAVERLLGISRGKGKRI